MFQTVPRLSRRLECLDIYDHRMHLNQIPLGRIERDYAPLPVAYRSVWLFRYDSTLAALLQILQYQ